MYKTGERLFIVRNHWVTGCFKQCQAAFMRKYGGRNPPRYKTIASLVKKLETKG